MNTVDICTCSRPVISDTSLESINQQSGLDINHLERGLRVIPTDKKNWLFCWTEIGTERVAVIQSLLTTCKLQGVNSYTYIVDVLQRIRRHPARRVVELTPRVWQEKFAGHPSGSDLDSHGN